LGPATAPGVPAPNWRCYVGSRHPWLERLLWPAVGHLIRFRGLDEAYCCRPGCTWSDLF
jgi:hypothetical protein